MNSIVRKCFCVSIEINYEKTPDYAPGVIAVQ